MGNTTEVRVAELVLDYDIYPRHDISNANVASLRKAYAAGVPIPPPIVDADTMRVVDGFHRVRAHNPGGTILVELRKYKTEADIWKDAAGPNMRHGHRLSRWDQARAVLQAEDLGIEIEAIADTLGLTVDAIGALRSEKTARDSTGKPVPIKATARHLAGHKLTKKQQRSIERSGGLSVRFYVRQVINAINGDLLNTSDAELLADLSELRQVLAELDLNSAA